jgi:TrmH family RNA methyltransferase
VKSKERNLILHCRRLLNDRNYREEQKSCLIEGRNLIYDLLKTRRAKRLFLGPSEPLIEGADELIHVSRETIERISATKNPDNIIAEFEKPALGKLSSERFVIAIDSIQDPGNLGTIIRTARALNWDALFLIEPCCDPFNDKALRAAKGATFDLPIQKGSLQELQSFAREKKLSLYAADLHGKDAREIESNNGIVLLFGSEAAGIDPLLTIDRVTIAMKQGSDSLNVAQAAAILMYIVKK